MTRTVEEHQRVVDQLVRTSPSTRLSLDSSVGLVLASDVVAPLDLPPFDNSAMDGYAVRGLPSLPATLPVIADIPAGAPSFEPLRYGSAARIMTGAPTPEGTEVIVPVESTDAGIDAVTITQAPEPGVHIRRRGEDVRAGDRVLAAGTVVGPRHVGVAAALGLPVLDVFAPVQVLVLSTGSELVAQGQPLGPGQIYESNAHLLAAAIRGIGAQATVAHFVPDDEAAFLAAVAAQSADVDLIVTTGGVSAGAYEVVKDAFANRGVEFVKVAMQPGGPQGAGVFEGLPVVTLPGNPVSVFVSFEVFLRPVLLRAMGFRQTHRPVSHDPLGSALTSPAGRRQFRRAVHGSASGTVAAWGGPGSHLLAWLAGADSMLVVPENVTQLGAGDLVEVWSLQ